MRRFRLEPVRIGHFGDIYQELRFIFESLPKTAPQRAQLCALARGISDFEGSSFNLDGFWPEV